MVASERSPTRVLLVDDDPAFRKVYRGLLSNDGHLVVEAEDRPGARSAIQRERFDAVLLDLMLPPDGSAKRGIEEIGTLLAIDPATKIVVVSGVGDVPHMVRAVRQGAYDFLTKPVDPDVLLIVVQRAIARARLEREVESLRTAVAAQRPSGGMLGNSPKLVDAIRLAERVAPSDIPVLITGETGTGKELMARLVHDRSHRSNKPFVAVNCGALATDLLESTLFGHVKGAFTNALHDRQGLFVEAHGGTLFLDEVGDMPAAMQVKLLRTLESGEVVPVGKDKPVTADVRLICATNVDLEKLRSEGGFRDDLYWRIHGVQISVPPLRERPSDLPLLAAHFLAQAAALTSTGQPKRLGEETLAKMSVWGWPGNLRELKHRMQQATVLAGAREELTAEDLGLTGSVGDSRASTLHEKVEALEAREIEAALAANHGNRSHAAEALGLSRQGLLNKMERYRLG